jgi:hypothetical protein
MSAQPVFANIAFRVASQYSDLYPAGTFDGQARGFPSSPASRCSASAACDCAVPSRSRSAANSALLRSKPLSRPTYPS